MMAKANYGKQEMAYKMRFAGKKCKDIAKDLIVSTATMARWMKNYNKQSFEDAIKTEKFKALLQVPKPAKIGKCEMNRLHLEALKENRHRLRIEKDSCWEEALKVEEAIREEKKLYDAYPECRE